MKFSAKDRISHEVFGTGTILEINPQYTTIAFDSEGTRKFVTDIVKLAHSDTDQPVKRTARKKAKRAK